MPKQDNTLLILGAAGFAAFALSKSEFFAKAGSGIGDVVEGTGKLVKGAGTAGAGIGSGISDIAITAGETFESAGGFVQSFFDVFSNTIRNFGQPADREIPPPLIAPIPVEKQITEFLRRGQTLDQANLNTINLAGGGSPVVFGGGSFSGGAGGSFGGERTTLTIPELSARNLQQSDEQKIENFKNTFGRDPIVSINPFLGRIELK